MIRTQKQVLYTTVMHFTVIYLPMLFHYVCLALVHYGLLFCCLDIRKETVSELHRNTIYKTNLDVLLQKNVKQDHFIFVQENR